MKPGRKTRYVTFPRSKVYHKMGEGGRTLCGLNPLGKGAQLRMFVPFTTEPPTTREYCVNCQTNERFGNYTMANLQRKRDAKVQA